MFKPLTALLALGAVACLALPAHAETGPAAAVAVAAPAVLVSLRTAATVSDAQIRLGDLFDGAGAHADDVVAKAPAAGLATNFDVSWLYATARAHGLNWQPPSSAASIRVERASTTIETAELAKQLSDKLPSTTPNRRVELDAQFRLFVPIGGSPDIGLERVDLKQDSGRFSAEVRVPANDPDAVPVHVSGRVVALMDVAVLARPMMPGEVVRPEDITTASFRLDQVPAGSIVDGRELVGQSPRHPLRAAQLLRSSDLQLPVVIKRNDLVLIVLERPGLYMTAEGRALEDGGLGGTIRVLNTQSKRTIDALVVGSDQVTVRMGPVQQASN